MSNLIYTNILHNPRKILWLSVIEYVVCDMIYHLSNNPKHNWCIMTRENMWKEVWLSKQWLMKVIERLILCWLIEKDENTKFIKTTQKRYDVCIKDGKQSLPTVNNMYSDGKQSSPTVNKVDRHGKQSLPNIYNNINNNINKDIVSKDTTTIVDILSSSDIILTNSDENTPLVPLVPPVEYVPKQITTEINDVIQIIKNKCKEYGVMYQWDWQERIYAKHLLSKKFINNILEQTGYELKPFLEAIIMLSTKVKYAKQISSAKSIYYNRADTVNKAKKENIQVQWTQKRVFTYS